jgi:hypothetical protein
MYLLSNHKSSFYAYAQCTHKFLMRIVSALISFFSYAQYVLKRPFQVWNFYAEHIHKELMLTFLMRMLSERIRRYLMRMLSARISS